MRRLFAITLLLVVGVLLAACTSASEKQLVLVREMEVPVRAYREDGAWAGIPPSRYTKNWEDPTFSGVIFHLGPDFANLDDPTWWDRLHADMERAFSQAPEHPALHEVPPVEWLKQNASRGDKTHYLVAVTLPFGGRLQGGISEVAFNRYIRDIENGEYHIHGPGDLINPMQIALEDGTQIFSAEVPFRENGEGSYIGELYRVQMTSNGTLLYEFSDKTRYATLVLPQELMEMGKSQLAVGQPCETVIIAKVYAP